MICLKTRASLHLHHSTLGFINDEGNKSLSQGSSSSEPYFDDSQTVQKNVTGLVGITKINMRYKMLYKT